MTRLCRPYSTSASPSGYTLYSIDTTTKAKTVIAQETGRAVHWMAASESGKELVVGRGRVVTESDFTPDTAFTFDSLTAIDREQGWWTVETSETATCEVAFLSTSDGSALRPAVPSNVACEIAERGMGTIAPIMNGDPSSRPGKSLAGAAGPRSRPRTSGGMPDRRR